MRRRLSLTFDAPAAQVREAFEALPTPEIDHGVTLTLVPSADAGDGTVDAAGAVTSGDPPADAEPGLAPAQAGAPSGAVTPAAETDVVPADGSEPGSGSDPGESSTTITIEARIDIFIPYFGWFFAPALKRELRRRLDDTGRRIDADLAGEPAPPPYRPTALLPPDNFEPGQVRQLATIAVLTALANFGGALLGQFGAPVAESFDVSDSALGAGLATARMGVLVAIFAAALADRRGRRKLMLVAFAGVAIANGISALAPSFAAFVAPQVFTRALTTGALIVAGIAAIEQAPEKARAYTLALMGLAGGAGFGIAVLLLPIADLATWAWRIPFVVSAMTLLALAPLRRGLVETSRYTKLVGRDAPRGRLREVVDKTYRWRFAALAAVAFLTNVFSAPAAQLTNRFLIEERDFSNVGVALFRGVTSGLPGLLGILLAGYLAERRGRRPLAVVALILATLFQMGVFLGEGEIIWFAASISIVAAASAGLAFSTYGGELFPTEVRGTSSALLVIFGVAGAIVGLLVATNLDRIAGTSLGGSMAWLGVAPLLCAVLVVPWLPETKDDLLDEVSPSEV